MNCEADIVEHAAVLSGSDRSASGQGGHLFQSENKELCGRNYRMDNIYRRDHEMAYISDESVTAQQNVTKKAVREYNEAMPFEPEKGMECLERTGIRHKKNVYFEPPFHCEYGNHIEVGENFYANTNCVMLDVGKITIGDNVLGAGSVVTKDIPDNVCAAGNPCRVIREITDADKPYYFRDRKFDEEAWAKINEK